MDLSLILRLDDVAARAVPAADVQDIEGWLARRSPGLETKRANSVLARTHQTELDIEGKMVAAEAFFADRGLPARYQITPASQPPDLEDRLRRRGYAADAPTAVQSCDLPRLADLPVPPGAAVQIASAPTPAWWETWQASLGIAPARADAVSVLFKRIEQATAFATVSIGGRMAAVALGVHDQGDQAWLGIFNMATLPGERRHGAARTALGALARWGHDRGASSAYLQVELGNAPARVLYRAAGFTDIYQYVYLSQPDA